MDEETKTLLTQIAKSTAAIEQFAAWLKGEMMEPERGTRARLRAIEELLENGHAVLGTIPTILRRMSRIKIGEVTEWPQRLPPKLSER